MRHLISSPWSSPCISAFLRACFTVGQEGMRRSKGYDRE